MALIQVTPEMLRNKARELMKLKEQHDETMNKIRTLVNGINEQWKGEAQQAYVDRFNGMESTFKQFSESLKTFSDLMKTSADDLEQADQGARNRINNV